MEFEGAGIKLRDIAKADGVRAVGLAEADVEKALRDAMYEGAAGLRRAEVEIWVARQAVAAKLVSFPNVMTENAIMNIGSGLLSPVTITDTAISK